MLGVCLAGGAGGIVVMAVTTPTITLASARPWVVTVGESSRTLYPGVNATMPYEIKNDSGQPRVLHTASVELKNDGIGMWDGNSDRFVDECRVDWFRATTVIAPTGVEVPPGGSTDGTVAIDFDRAAASQHTCDNIALDVTVTAG
jgi:hypothetical protein